MAPEREKSKQRTCLIISDDSESDSENTPNNDKRRKLRLVRYQGSWVKTYPTYRKIPNSDKIKMIELHAHCARKPFNVKWSFMDEQLRKTHPRIHGKKL